MSSTDRVILVKQVQRELGIVEDGIDGMQTWLAISKRVCGVQLPTSIISTPISSPSPLSERALKLIIDYEVGGGEAYYNKKLKQPCWPGGASGVTIGIGYDLGYNTTGQFTRDWKELLPPTDFNRLTTVLGYKSESARKQVASVKNINIPWENALIVFNKNTLPRFMAETIKAFPGADKLHPDAFGALVSIVFNRGASTTGPSRVEMFNIQTSIKTGSKNIYPYIAQQILSMKRLWVGKNLDGLLRRRDEEAALVVSCV